MTINRTPNLCLSQETPPTAGQRNGSETGCKTVLDNCSAVRTRPAAGDLRPWLHPLSALGRWAQAGCPFPAPGASAPWPDSKTHNSHAGSSLRPTLRSRAPGVCIFSNTHRTVARKGTEDSEGDTAQLMQQRQCTAAARGWSRPGAGWAVLWSWRKEGGAAAWGQQCPRLSPAAPGGLPLQAGRWLGAGALGVGAAGQAQGKPAPPGKVRVRAASCRPGRTDSWRPAPVKPSTSTTVRGELGESKAPVGQSRTLAR